MSFTPSVTPPFSPELVSLYKISILPSKNHLQNYFEEMMTILSGYFPVKYSSLFLQDHENNSLRLEALYGIEKENHPLLCTLQKGIIGRVFESRQPTIIRNIDQDPLYEELMKKHEKAQPPLLCFPLLMNAESLGVININPLYLPVNDFVKDFQFLAILSAILSPVIKNYQLKKGEPAGKAAKSKMKSHHLDEILEERLTEVMDKIAPYAEIKMNMGIFDDIIRAVEKILIKSALEKVDHVQIAAAQLLGINRNTLRKKIKEMKIKNR